MKIKNKSVLFYGAIGRKDKIIVGGGESGNLKTLNILSILGFNIIRLHKPYPLKKNYFGYFYYLFQLFYCLLKFIKLLISKQHIHYIHISGFYLHLIYFEYILVIVGKMFGKNVVYELRGGGLIEAYESRSSFYRRIFRSTLKHSDKILSQGFTYLNFIKKISNKEAMYFPNFIFEDAHSALNYEFDCTDKINIIYFGRIVESKNIDFIIEICKVLKERNHSFTCEIVGEGNSEYISKISETIKILELEEYVKIKPPFFNNELQKLLIGKNFFLFPSKEKREGHSNSLTEAMYYGVVPIASNAGFNQEIIGNEKLIMKNFDAEQYATAITTIWNHGWFEYSKFCKQRVISNFTKNKAVEVLSNCYTNE